MSEARKSLLALHLAVFLFGFTAILGDLITLDAVSLVWWRLVLASLAFIPVLWWKKLWNSSVFRLHWRRLFAVSFFLTAHWVAFFLSVKLANASVALLCMATTSFMTALVEPWITGRSFRGMEIGFGLLIVPGMYLVVSSLGTSMYLGVFFGLLAALLAALFTTINKSIVGEGSTIFFTSIELGVAVIILSLALMIAGGFGYENQLWRVGNEDWKYLLILAVLCTTLAYTLAFNALKSMTAFMTNLIVTLEPIYGIIMAALILNDNKDLDLYFYLGAGMIIAVVIIFPILDRRTKNLINTPNDARII